MAIDTVTNIERLFQRYQELQRYVGWTPHDAARVRSVAELLENNLVPLIDDFYEEIERHPDARKVITGGDKQIERLKGTLRTWLRELLFGPYDRDYVTRRWKVGWRHVEIGLDQVYTNVALSRLRRGLLLALQKKWRGDPADAMPIRHSLNTLLDLDLAIIEDAYQTEHLARQQLSERLAARETSGAAFRTLVPINATARLEGLVTHSAPARHLHRCPCSPDRHDSAWRASAVHFADDSARLETIWQRS
jgi:hypothetical protein